MNGNVPGSFLVAFEQSTRCVNKATVDFVSVLGCESGRRPMHCRVRVLQKGSREQAHKLVPIPYHSNNRTLQVEFADDLVFKKGSGLILDISHCEKIQDAFRCDNPDFEADSCLEDLELGQKVGDAAIFRFFVFLEAAKRPRGLASSVDLQLVAGIPGILPPLSKSDRGHLSCGPRV